MRWERHGGGVKDELVCRLGGWEEGEGCGKEVGGSGSRRVVVEDRSCTTGRLWGQEPGQG